MAFRALVTLLKVKDSASQPMRRVEKSFRGVSKAVKKTGANFTEFNRIMFSTSAFVGLFQRQFQLLADTLNQGANLDRLTRQFQQAMGPRGDMFKAIAQFTDLAIDRMTVMQEALALRNLGISRNQQQTARIFAMSAAAAKKANLSSTEGIKRVVQFLKTGSVEGLAFLNVLAPTNMQLQMQMAVLKKAGGMMGKVMSLQQRLNLGMAALAAASRGAMFGQRDLSDITFELGERFGFLRSELGVFLGKALTPTFEKVVRMTDSITDLVHRLHTMDKTILKTVKNLVIVGTTFASVLATVGTARLIFKALGALGLGGIPFVATALLGLAAAFSDVEAATKGFVDMGKMIGGVLLGSFQLISSFLGDADNFSQGIGKMDSNLKNFLREKGLLKVTTNISRFSAMVISFVRDAGRTLIDWFKIAYGWIEKLLNKLGGLAASFGLVKEGAEDTTGAGTPWSRKLIEGQGGVRGLMVKGAAAFMGAQLLGRVPILGSLLKKTPLIGGLFGGTGGRGPKGTKSDPIYTVESTGVARKFVRGLFSPDKAMFPTFGKWARGAGGFLRGPSTRGLTGRAFERARFNRMLHGTLGKGGLFKHVLRNIGLGAAVKAGQRGGLSAGLKATGSILAGKLPKGLKGLARVTFNLLSRFTKFAGVIGRGLSIIGRFLAPLAAVAVVGTAIVGFGKGIWETREGFMNLAISIKNLAKAAGDFIGRLVQGNPVLKFMWEKIKWVGEKFWEVGKFLLRLPITLLELILEGWKNIGGGIGVLAQKLGEQLNEWTRSLNKSMADEERGKGKRPSEMFGVPEGAGVPMSLEQLDALALGLRIARVPVPGKGGDDDADTFAKKYHVASVPKMPESEPMKQALLQSSIEKLEGLEQARMKVAMIQAMETQSPDGTTITREEWTNIFRRAMNLADVTKHSKKTAEKEEKPDTEFMSKSHRC